MDSFSYVVVHVVHLFIRCNQKIIQGDKKVSVHLMITVQLLGAQRLFHHPVQVK